MSEHTAADSLSLQAIHSTPVSVSDWTGVFYPDHEETSGDYWARFDYDPRDTGLPFDTFTLVESRGAVVGVVVAGTVYREWDWDWDDYDEARQDRPELPEITEDTWAMLMDVDPSQWGSEGPMMNYWYPLNEDTQGWSSFDPIEAAALLDGPLCVVEVDGAYGLALTGGGMDLSWDVCDAFVSLGLAPPTHFADLPDYGTWGEQQNRVYAAMLRSLTVVEEQAQHRITRLVDQRARYGGDAAV